MDYHHYSELCMPADNLMPDPYVNEYATQYQLPVIRRAEFEIRSNVVVDGGDRFGVSAVVFDNFEELIWMGNQGGHVTSYYGPGMQKYTSFQIHHSEEVRDIITTEQGIFALTKSTLRHQIRRGIPKHTHKSANMTNMQCLFQVNVSSLLIGGHQDKLINFDLNKMTETIIPVQQEGCAVIRSGGGALVACGSANGTVALRDIRSPALAEHTFRAHSSCLSDLDMQGDLLITCGFTESANGAIPESYVVIWDVRRLRGNKVNDGGAWSLPTVSPPLLLHFLPAFSGRAMAVAGDGHVALLDVNKVEVDQEQTVFQIGTHNSHCSVVDVSSTSQALVFGDLAGHLQLFSHHYNHEPVFNNFSRATEFADSVVGLPCMSLSDTSFKFSSIPKAPLTTGTNWFNNMPNEFFKKTYRKPKPIDPEVLKSMKMQGPIGYAPNPGTFRRNQMPYIEDTLEDLNSSKQNDFILNSQPVPKHYQKLDLRYNKHGPNEELQIYNRTGFPGLEATVPNSYCNAMVQVLYYTKAVKTAILTHTCAKEFCVSCELGFLFRVLDSSQGTPCQANNFLRAFRTVREAAALGLIMSERDIVDPNTDLIGLIQSWNRFILHQIHFEMIASRKKEQLVQQMSQNASVTQKSRTAPNTLNGQFGDEYRYTELEFVGPAESEALDHSRDANWRPTQPAVHVMNEAQSENFNQESPSERREDTSDSEISQLFAIRRHQLNKCLKCSKEEERNSVVLECALQYPMARETQAENSEPEGGFLELMVASLTSRRSTPAWCEKCSRFTPTSQRGKVVRLPPILAINCGGTSAHEKAYWAKGVQKDQMNSEAVKKGGGSGKLCRYGVQCARLGCRFKHPEKQTSSQSTSRSAESYCVLPYQLVIRLQPDGDVIVRDKIDRSESQPNSPLRYETSKGKKKNVPAKCEEEYTLSAAVVCVEDNPKNLVSYINIPNHDGESQWYLFNDLCIVPVSLEEVVQFSAWWKTPCVLIYCSKKVQCYE